MINEILRNLDCNELLPTWRELGKRSFWFFCKYILGLKVKWFHSEIGRVFNEHSAVLLLAPRGSGKSTIGTVAWIVWNIVKNPDIAIGLISYSQDQAVSFLREVREYLRQISVWYPEVKMTVDKNEEIIVAGRKTVRKEATVKTYGWGGSITGMHFDMLVIDDLVKEENTRTANQRYRLETWFKMTLKPVLKKTGKLYMIGTRYHPLDLYSVVIRDKIVDVVLHFPAEVNGVSLWEEELPMSYLKKEQQRLGSTIYSLQYLNSIENLIKSQLFQPEWISLYEGSYDTDNFVYFTMGVDLAMSTKGRADYTAVSVVGHHKNGYAVLVDIKWGRWTLTQIEFEINQLYKKWKPTVIYIEDVAAQNYMIQLLRTKYALPVRSVKIKVDKVTRARVLSAMCEQGKFRWDKGHWERIKDYILPFPAVEHDDIVDSITIQNDEFHLYLGMNVNEDTDMEIEYVPVDDLIGY